MKNDTKISAEENERENNSTLTSGQDCHGKKTNDHVNLNFAGQRQCVFAFKSHQMNMSQKKKKRLV